MTALPVSASGATAMEVARRCAQVAGEVTLAHFRRVTARAKGTESRNLVTEADGAVERAVLDVLAAEFPGHAVLAEESATDAWSDGWLWVCDPIDGTRNFSQGIPHFAFSLALCHGGEPLLGIITQPLTGWEFATDGTGVTFNGEPCRVSAKTRLADAVVAIDLGYDQERGARQADLVVATWPRATSVRVSGSAALGFAYLAAGLWDAYVHRQLSPWDGAAGLALVRAAGGLCHDLSGGEATLHSEGVIAAAPGIMAELSALTAGVPRRA